MARISEETDTAIKKYCAGTYSRRFYYGDFITAAAKKFMIEYPDPEASPVNEYANARTGRVFPKKFTNNDPRK